MADRRTLLTLGETPVSIPGVAIAGQIIGGYRVERQAGAGGMGVVYRAVDEELGRLVALKLIAPEFASNERFRELFKDESRKAAGLEHPNVIPIYRSGEDGGQLYIAMRFVDGASLQNLIDRRGRLPVGATVRIVSQIADALDAAHAHGLVHRDVKPGNVLLAEAPGEEGLSVPVAEGRSTGDGRYAGTPAYLSPEQIRGEAVDARTDVYALGCVLFHALTGRVPFDVKGFDATVVAHLTEAPPSMGAIVPGIPAKLDEVVRTAMAKQPDDRYASAGDLAAAAREARSDVVICYHPGDAAAAAAVARRLGTQGLDARLAAGDVSDDLWSAHACLVLVGRADLASWARDLLSAAGEIASLDPRFRLVSVLLPGSPDPFDPQIAFLASRPFVDLRGGVDDPHATGDLLRAVDAAPLRSLTSEAATGDLCPYRGLEAFQEEDAALFFGRERESALIREKLRESRFLAVLGASGSGKSSLVRAGVLPQMRADGDTRIVVMAPGASPLATLAAQLEGVAGTSAPSAATLLDDPRTLDRVAGELARSGEGTQLVVVVDQFEEVFSLCQDLRERRAFIDNLVYAATIPGGHAAVIVAMRSDFYHRCADHPSLRALVAEEQFLVGPLDADGLRRAIEEPARQAGLELERGLVRRILTDVADQPGALPLMEHLLLELWRRRRGRFLTLEAYTACGGVSGALAKRANEVYEGFDPARQAIARRVLLRLTQPGEGTEDTRRRAAIEELTTAGEERSEVEAVVSALTEARLLTAGRDESSGEPVVDVTHEALIRGWPELRTWIDEDREGLRLHRRLTDAVTEWQVGGREEGLLYRGTRLGVWDGRDLSALNAGERDFLSASRERAQRDRAARRRRIQFVLWGLGVAVVIVSALAVFGFVQRGNASDQRDVAQSRALAANARLQLDSDPELALLLARRAYDVDATAQAEGILRQATFESTVRASHRAHDGTVRDVAVNPASGIVASAGDDGTIRLWDPTADRAPVAIAAGQGAIQSVDFSADGSRLASAGADGSVRTWEAAGKPLNRLKASQGTVNSVAFRPDGAELVTSGADGLVRIWRVRDGARLQVLRGHEGPVWDARFSGDGQRLVTAGDDTTVRVWSVRGDQLRVLRGHSAGVLSASFSPDGRRVVSGAGDFTARVWNLEDLSSRPLVLRAAQTQGSNSVGFSSDGRHIVSAGLDGTIRVWDVDGRLLVILRGHEGGVLAASFTPDGRRVVSAGKDGSVRVWEWGHDLPTAELHSATDFPVDGGASFAPDGATVLSIDITGALRKWLPGTGGLTPVAPAEVPEGDFARVGVLGRDGSTVATARLDGTVVVRSIAPPGARRFLRGQQGPVWSLGFRPDGRLLAAGGGDGTVNVWDLSSGKATVLRGHSKPVNAVRFSEDGHLLVTASDDETVRVWNVDKAAPVAVLSGHTGPVLDASLSPDGARVASGSSDRSVRVWSVATGAFISLAGHQNSVYTAEFDRSGTRLLSVADDGLRVWDPARGTSMLEIPAPARDAYKASFSRDGSRIVVQTFDQNLRVYPCETCGPVRDVLTLAAQRTTRELTPQERSTFLTGTP